MGLCCRMPHLVEAILAQRLACRLHRCEAPLRQVALENGAQKIAIAHASLPQDSILQHHDANGRGTNSTFLWHGFVSAA